MFQPSDIWAQGLSPSSFHIEILDGEGALNNVKGRVAREPIIQVEDENHKPVAGAAVLFEVVGGGPGATFADGATTLSTVTDAAGRAVAKGLINNQVAGKFTIHVRVTYQGQTAETSIHQVNVTQTTANAAKGVESNAVAPGAATALAAAAGVLGIASTAGELLLNGTSVQGNANLTNGVRVESLARPVELFLHNGCQFILGPQSAATIGETQVTLEKGAVRGEPFAKCKVVSNGMQISGTPETAEGVVRLVGTRVQVASIDGTIQVVNASGAVVGNVSTGTATAFSSGTAVAASGASGASAGVGITDKTAITVAIVATAAAGAAAGTAAVLNSPPTSR